MFFHRSKFLIAAVLTSAIIASCGGGDDSSRSRNVALDGKQQCLSDAATTIDADGLVLLSFCTDAVSYEVFEGATVVVPKTDIESNSIPQLQAPAGAHTFRVVAYKTDGTQAGEDVVTTKTEACSTGGTCVVGDTGPGGGIVVYDAGSQQDWGQYIEMARKGWFDGTEGPNASADPFATFGCYGKYAGTSSTDFVLTKSYPWGMDKPYWIGSGKENTDKFVKNCDATTSEGSPRAYTLVNGYRSVANPSLNDWAIPTGYDALEIQKSSAITALELPFQFALSNEHIDSHDTLVSFWRLGLKDWAIPWQLPSMQKSTSSEIFVRPVRYFSSTGPVTPTVKVVGMMDIPTSSSSSTSTTEAPVSTPVDPYPAPTDVTITGDDSVLITWNSPVSAADESYIVTYKKEGGAEVSSNPIPNRNLRLDLSLFEANIEYTFVVHRIDDKGNRISSEPVPQMLLISIGDNEGAPFVPASPVTQDTTPATSPVMNMTPTETAPVSNETPATSATDCTVAPTVTYPKGIITSDDTVTFTITHPCMGLNQPKELNVGRAVFDENNEPVFDRYQNINVNGDVVERKARLAAGDHTFLFLLQFTPHLGSEMYQSEAARIDISVSEGPSKTSPICSPDKITVVGTTLSVACPYIQGLFTISLPFEGQQEMMTFLEFSGDKETYTADLSTMNSGWRRAHLTVNYGLESVTSQLAVCVRECAMSSSADPFEMTIKDDVASISFASGCSGNSFVNQAFRASDNLYFVTDDSTIFFDDKSVVDISLRQSTAALVFGRWCEGDGLPFTNTFVSLGRNASAPTAEDLLPVVNTTVATVALTELTGGMTDLPVGKTEGGSVSVSPQAESVAITPDVVKELFNVTIAGSKVETIEMSTDGKSWIPATFGALPLPAEVKSMSVRLTAENGTQAVITRDVERVETTVVVAESADSGSQSILSYWWILLLLFVLLAGAMAVKKKRTT
jgi:hypothetical protein